MSFFGPFYFWFFELMSSNGALILVVCLKWRPWMLDLLLFVGFDVGATLF